MCQTSKQESIESVNIECQYNKYGCKFRSSNQFTLDTHYEEDISLHLNMLFISYDKQMNSITTSLDNHPLRDVEVSKSLFTHASIGMNEENVLIKRQKSNEPNENDMNDQCSSLVITLF